MGALTLQLMWNRKTMKKRVNLRIKAREDARMKRERQYEVCRRALQDIAA